MLNLLHQYEKEKRKLNELGRRSLEQGIPLYGNEAVQAQSRRVDELIVQLHKNKTERQKRLRQ